MAESQVSTESVVALAVQNTQNGQEQVEDIQVERDRRGNLLLDMMVPHDHLRIDEDITGENQRRNPAVDQLAGAAHGEEQPDEAEQEQHPQRAKQIRHPAGKVILGLARKQGQKDEDAEGEDQRLQDDARAVEGRDDADGVGLERGECGQVQQVRRVAAALPERQEHEPDGADERHEHQPRVCLDPGAVGVAEEGDAAEDGGEKELDGSVFIISWLASTSPAVRLIPSILGEKGRYVQNRIHLADELHADRQRALRNGAAKL